MFRAAYSLQLARQFASEAIMKKHVFTLICIAIMLFATNGYCGDVFLLALSGDIVEYNADSGEMKTLIRNVNEYYSSVCYDKQSNTLYFSTQLAIYSKYLGLPDSPINKTFDGKYPSVSPGGRFISFYRRFNEINIYDTISKKTVYVGADAKTIPAVWISDTKLMYITEYKQVRVIDAVSNKISGSWPDGVYPIALSPDGKAVLCVTDNFSSILLYKTDGNYVDTIKKPGFFFKTSERLVWSSSGRSFIYVRRRNTFSLSISDSPYDLYMFNIDTRKEKRVMSKVVLWGGVCIDSNDK